MHMNTQEKIWGSTTEIFNKNNVSIHRIYINQGACCSKHYHEYKYNVFYIESGRILIQEWDTGCESIKENILVTGDIYTIPPQKKHRFIALENSIVYEIYYVELQNNDIVRLDIHPVTKNIEN